ncbi:HypC/HybG/HupF family hydrogenase formation chaperone [Azospirillum halopraeferens]|uniref:HypC/HybG/HupF family hydrogenase formation chaperone n=1 Tax=Azospirillum halopraeferens TaxID=34010 RepID=UPI00041A4133|nr:HypC/HybG/HupF family hydrogenase formation chaperone [Azospirillum halopraeferens]
MCLGIPMQVIETDGLVARCAGRGAERTVSLMLAGPVPPGGWVLVHRNDAVRILDDEELGPLNDALDALVLSMRGENTDHLFADIIAAREAEG